MHDLKTKYTIRRVVYWKCTKCNNGILETGEDEYGSYYSIDCTLCNGFGLRTRYDEVPVRQNKNGTFTPLSKFREIVIDNNPET